MNTQASLHIATKDVAADRATREPRAEALTMIIGALVVMTCFAAPLLLTLPKAMDAAATPTPLIGEAAAADLTGPAFHERYPVQASQDWVDSLEESALAQWRMRASD
jgi:hypothetical protein